MHRVVVGMDDKVLDVGDSYSGLHVFVESWLVQHVGPEHVAWCKAYDPHAGYCVLFVTESDAVQFKLTWL